MPPRFFPGCTRLRRKSDRPGGTGRDFALGLRATHAACDPNPAQSRPQRRNLIANETRRAMRRTGRPTRRTEATRAPRTHHRRDSKPDVGGLQQCGGGATEAARFPSPPPRLHPQHDRRTQARSAATSPAVRTAASSPAPRAIIDDLPIPGALHARFVRSPHAHARIRRHRPTEAASNLPGVVTVATGHDLAQWTQPLRLAPPIEGLHPVTIETLPTAKVRFHGDPVACVVATDRVRRGRRGGASACRLRTAAAR